MSTEPEAFLHAHMPVVRRALSRPSFGGRTVNELLGRTKFSFALLKRAVTERAFSAALEAIRANAERRGALKAFDHPVSTRGKRTQGHASGRPALISPRDYARLALRYDEIEAVGSEFGDSTRRKLATEYKVSETTIAKRLQRARELGFIESTNPRQRGGHATVKAHRLIEGK